MRVGIVSPPWYAVPPTGYGGIELVVGLLADRLVRAGVDVTLFATGDSRTEARLEYVYETPPSERIGETIWELDHVLAAYARAREFDIVHDHSGTLGLALLATTSVPVVHTVHGPLDPRMTGLYSRICTATPGAAWLTSLSRAQRRPGPRLPWLANVPNAIDVDLFSPGPQRREDFLLFLGRMCADKGAHRAIEVARAAGRPLVMAAKCREPAERRFFAEHVEPHLGDDVEFVGEASLHEKVSLLRRAAATLVPIEWDEPFGLVMIESGACGTPVIATRRGSVPEVVEDGVTGIVVDHHSEMPAALERALSLDPQGIRSAVVERFAPDRMATRYLEAYEAALTRRQRGHAPGRRRDQRLVRSETPVALGPEPARRRGVEPRSRSSSA